MKRARVVEVTYTNGNGEGRRKFAVETRHFIFWWRRIDMDPVESLVKAENVRDLINSERKIYE